MGAGLASSCLRPEADTMELSVLSSLLCLANLLEFEAETLLPECVLRPPLLVYGWGFGWSWGRGCLFNS